MPRLSVAHLDDNNMTNLSPRPLSTDLAALTFLNLEMNALDWPEVHEALSSLPALATLIVKRNMIKRVLSLPSDGRAWAQLHTLAVDHNCIDDVRLGEENGDKCL